MRFFPTDIYYLILVIPAFLFSLVAQIMVKTAFNKYSKVRPMGGLTGHDAARMILDSYNLGDIPVRATGGTLTDHFSPQEGAIYLSQPTFNVSSVAAIGVAAHEAGHAVQHSVQYMPIRVRQAVIPVTRFGSMASWPVMLVGLMLNSRLLMLAGIVLFSFVALFQIVTLPVEFNASNRAVKILESSYMLTPEELVGAKKVLRAAALTYVAALAVSLMNLLRMILLSRRRG